MSHIGRIPLLLGAFALGLCGCGEDAQIASPGGGSEDDWNISGYELITDEDDSWEIPGGTILHPGTYLLIIQGTSDEDGPTLIDNFLEFYEEERSENVLIFQTDGDLEIRGRAFSFYDDAGDLLDGPAPAADNDENWQRLRGDFDADDLTAWERTSGGFTASPGWGQYDRVSPDYPYVSEVSDGSDDHPFFSFVEIYLGSPDDGEE